MNRYIFTSERLGFRNWYDTDLEPMAKINADPEVMEFFPAVQSSEQTAAFIQRMQELYLEKGYCYFAVETLADGQFIGFTGLAWQTYDAPFTPCVDIGWRLDRKAWGRGYATEGAQRCLEYAFKSLQLEQVTAVAPLVNDRSVAVMEKAGMKEWLRFRHPVLQDHPALVDCVCYVSRSNR